MMNRLGSRDTALLLAGAVFIALPASLVLGAASLAGLVALAPHVLTPHDEWHVPALLFGLTAVGSVAIACYWVALAFIFRGRASRVAKLACLTALACGVAMLPVVDSFVGLRGTLLYLAIGSVIVAAHAAYLLIAVPHT